MLIVGLIGLWGGLTLLVGIEAYAFGRAEQREIDAEEIAMRDEWIAGLESGRHVRVLIEEP